MPKKKIIAVFLLGILIFSLLLVPYFYREKFTFSAPVKKSSFFVTIPIVEWTYSGVPCVEIEAGSQKFVAMLDLGYTRYMSLNPEILGAISDKVLIKQVTSQGFRGNKYVNRIYQTPAVDLGELTLSPVLIEEENKNLQKEAAIFQNPESFVADGKLGWRLFQETVLFLDMKNDKIGVCDSISTLQANYSSLKSFVKIPFSLEKELIEFMITTPWGPLYCFLDSGCTLNHLQMKNRQNLSIQEILSDKSQTVRFDRVRIGKQEFGPIAFHPLPIALPIRTEAVLGMDFLLETQVVIDFKNHYIYFH